MENEENAMKESGNDKLNDKLKISTQDILVGLIIFGIIFAILIIFSGGAGSGATTLYFMFIVGVTIASGIILGSIIDVIISFIKFTKNQESLTLQQKKVIKNWIVFDIFFFLLLPVASIIYIAIFRSNIYTVIVFTVLSFLIASGVKGVAKNKNSGISSRISSWFLIIIGVALLLIILFF